MFFEKRSLKRIAVRKNEGISVTVNQKNSPQCSFARITDISSNGIGLEIENACTSLFQNTPHVGIEINCRNNQYQLQCTVAFIEEKTNGIVKAGLSRTDTDQPIQSSETLFTAVVSHPFYYEEAVLLNITDITSQKMIVECDDPEFTVFRNMPLSIQLNVSPKTKSSRVHGKVAGVSVQKSGQLLFEFMIDSISFETKQMIAYQLFINHGLNPCELRQKGLDSKSYRTLVKYRSVNTEQEYREVLKLRKQAYISVDKIPENSIDKDMASDLDSKSRILTAYHNKKLIGTVSLTFPDRESIILDTEKAFISGYPVEMPPKTTMIEIARLCIHEMYRSTDIMFGFFEHIYRILITSERDYIITSTDEYMWPLYEKIGFSKTGVSYNHHLLNGLRHHVIIIHRDSPVHRKNVSVLIWGQLYRNMTEYLIKTGALSFNLSENLRFFINKTFFYAAETLSERLLRFRRIK